MHRRVQRLCAYRAKTERGVPAVLVVVKESLSKVIT